MTMTTPTPRKAEGDLREKVLAALIDAMPSTVEITGPQTEWIADAILAALPHTGEQSGGAPVAWGPIAGFEGLYEVSDDGRVRRMPEGSERSPTRSGAGYRKVELWRGNQRHQRLIHRLVAEAFLAPPPEGFGEVNHKDGDKANNRASNLEWSNRRLNTDHSRYVLGNDVIAVVGTNAATGETVEFPAIAEAGRNGFRSRCIEGCLKGRRKSHLGYVWERARPAATQQPTGEGCSDRRCEALRKALQSVARGDFNHGSKRTHRNASAYAAWALRNIER